MRRADPGERPAKVGRAYLVCAWCKRLLEVRSLCGIEGDVRVYCRCFRCRGAARRSRSGKYG